MILDDLTRRAIEKRVNRIKVLFVHLIVTISLALAIMWAVDQLGLPQKAEDIIPLAVLMFVGHAMWLLYEEGRNYIIHQEMGRTQESSADLEEKPKRNGPLALDDDGEFADSFYNEESGNDHVRQHGQ